MLVKICGVSNAIDAMQAIRCGATAIGFVMGGKVLPVEVEPSAQLVREIIKNFPRNTLKKIDSFLVTHLMEVEDILALANYIGCSGIQVSEDIGVEKLRQLRKKTDKKIIKTVVVNNESIQKMKSYGPFCDFILLDTRFGGYTGGTGVTNDWNLCKKLIALAEKPVYIAGGLTPENLAEAIKITNPQGVDVSTGVSTYSESYLRKDRKDGEKIKTFITIARGRKDE